MEKILAWAILTAVLFFLVVTVAMLSGVPVNDGGRSWLVEGVPNWMQGIGTLAAAYFAWKAFATWRSQDDDKRRAAKAEEILLLSHQVVGALRSIRRKQEMIWNRPADYDLMIEQLETDDVRKAYNATGAVFERMRAM